MSGLTRVEKETLYLTNEEDDFYTISTYATTLKTQLAEYAERYPNCVRRFYRHRSVWRYIRSPKTE